MEKKKVSLVVLFVILILTNLVLVSMTLFNFSFNFPITGRSSLVAGGVIFTIGDRIIWIFSPENKIYDFETSELSYYDPIYALDLNVSSSFVASDWRYHLKQTTPSGQINTFSSATFTPNITMEVYRWSNDLTVYAKDAEEVEYSENVVFYVNVSNSAPLIDSLDSELYVCENKVLLYYFNSTDRDEDSLTSSISSSDPFYVGNPNKVNQTTTTFRLSSRIMRKQYVGGIGAGSQNYSYTIYVSDGEYFDSKSVNITAIELNNPLELANIGVQTVQTKGENSLFSYQASVLDIEDGNSNSENFNFSLGFLDSGDLFVINETGWMVFQPNESHLTNNATPKSYTIRLCVSDRELENPYSSIEEQCNQTGGSIEVCEQFVLTVTNENRNPLITSYHPLDPVVNFSGTETASFNASVFDPDGTIPDVYWYIEDELKKYDTGKSNSTFSYNFGCGVSGEYVIKAVATDGLLNDSVELNVNVEYVACPTTGGSSGGGGSGSGCSPDWTCGEWNVCQNLEKSLNNGFLSGKDYRALKLKCENGGLDDVFCGFQTRECVDLKECNIFSNMPSQTQVCYFTENPSCSDRLKNCHSGFCEIGVDCGGPCASCPTCSDELQNQGEKGVDCGGPCPWPCKVEDIYRVEFSWLSIIPLSVLILLVIIFVKIIRIINYRIVLKKKK